MYAIKIVSITANHKILVAESVNGLLEVNGSIVGPWIRKRALRGYTVYCSESVTSSQLAALIEDDDDYCFGKPSHVYGASIRTASRGRITFLSGDCWGLSGDASDCAKRLIEVSGFLDDTSFGFAQTAAACGSKIARHVAPYGFLIPLPERFRKAAHASLHVGPITHVAGGGYAAHIDRNGAFLESLFAPMPVNFWFNIPVGSESISESLDRECAIIAAEVTIHESEKTEQMPPLPVKYYGKTVYPFGRARGVWTSKLLKMAVESGEVSIDKVLGIISTNQSSNYLMPMYRLLKRYPKSVSKPIYTRFWGKLASSSTWTGSRREPQYGDSPGFGLWWRLESKESGDLRNPMYRPDIASFIVSSNLEEVIKTVRRTASGSLIATHIDSIWTRDIEAAREICESDKWKMVGSGNIRFYGHGTYTERLSSGRSRIAVMGLNGKPTISQLKQHISGSDTHSQYRVWSGNPTSDESAESIAPSLMFPDSIVVDCSFANPKLWTQGGKPARPETFIEESDVYE